jgi:hypothetical protein
MKKALIVVAAIGVAVAGVVLLWPEPQDQPPARPGPYAGWEAYRDERLGSSLRLPAGWHVQLFEDDDFQYWAFGMLISNVEFRFRHPHLGGGRGTNAWDMSGLPRTAVVIEFARQTGAFFAGPGCVSGPDIQSFPLDLDEARVVEGNSDDRAHGAHIPRLWLPLRRVSGDRFVYLTVWFGAKVTEEDRRTAELVVASISPPEASCTYRLV